MENNFIVTVLDHNPQTLWQWAQNSSSMKITANSTELITPYVPFNHRLLAGTVIRNDNSNHFPLVRVSAKESKGNVVGLIVEQKDINPLTVLRDFITYASTYVGKATAIHFNGPLLPDNPNGFTVIFAEVIRDFDPDDDNNLKDYLEKKGDYKSVSIFTDGDYNSIASLAIPALDYSTGAEFVSVQAPKGSLTYAPTLLKAKGQFLKSDFSNTKNKLFNL